MIRHTWHEEDLCGSRKIGIAIELNMTDKFGLEFDLSQNQLRLRSVGALRIDY